MIKRLMAKYTGKYRDLKPRGYVFQKLYARNYRTYRKEFGCNDSILIYQKGNDIELMDLYSRSGLLINCIIKNRDKLFDIIEDNHFHMRMNNKTGQIYNYNMGERRFIWKLERRLYKRMEKYGKRALDLYYKKWRIAFIPMDMIIEILDLYDAGLIGLEDKEFDE
jgi:hypothetical protein